MSTRITLRDIAQRAGFHFTTVGMALRDHPGISQVTKESIRKIAQEMGYRPNPMLSAWMSDVRQTRRKKTVNAAIAWLYYWDTEAWYRGAARRAEELGFALRRIWLGEPRLTDSRINQILSSSGIRGLIMAPRYAPHDQLSLNLDHLVPILIGHSVQSPRLHRVVHHQTHGMQLALRSVLERGFSRIGLVISDDMDGRTNNNYTSVYLRQQQDLPAAQRIPVFLKASIKGNPELSTWQAKHRPDCLLTFHSFVRGIRTHLCADIPIFDLDLRSYSHQGASGIDQNSAEQGAVAVDLVAADLSHNRTGIPSVPWTVLVEGKWVDGKPD